MRVLHVSGSPGSGKSTLGAQIAALRLAHVTVIDTDELLDTDKSPGLELAALKQTASAEEYCAYWAALFGLQISAAIKQAEGRGVRILVFVGILDHCGGPDAEPLEPAGVSERYFLDTAPARLLQQFYGRLYTSPTINTDEFWNGVAAGRYLIPNSAAVLASAERDKEWHAAHGYQMASPEQVKQRVRELAAQK